METTETTTMAPSLPKRPTFLTVICILTFIGSGWGIISAVRGYATADTTAAMVSESMGKAEDQMGSDSPSFMKSLMGSVASATSAPNIRKSSIVSLLSCLLTLMGAIMMWNLRKTGFYLYIAGIVVAVFTPLLIMDGMVGMMGAAGGGFIGLVFIIMYGVNLKYMS